MAYNRDYYLAYQKGRYISFYLSDKTKKVLDRMSIASGMKLTYGRLIKNLILGEKE